MSLLLVLRSAASGAATATPGPVTVTATFPAVTAEAVLPYATTSGLVAGGTAATAAFPAGLAAGDVLLCYVTSSSSSATVDTPAGWTKVDDAGVNAVDFTAWLFWRAWQSGDTPPTFNFSVAVDWAIDVYKVSGLDAANPINASSHSWTTTAANSWTLTVTPTIADAILVSFFPVDASGAQRTWTEDRGTEVFDRHDATHHRVLVTETLVGQNGVAQSVVGTVTGTAQDLGGIIVTLKPDAGGGATASPSPVAVTATYPSAEARAGSSPTLAVLAVAATLPAATAGVGATATPASTAVTATYPSAAARAGSSPTPSPTAVAATYPAAGARAGASPTPATTTVVATYPAAAARAGSTPTPATLAVVATLPAPSASGGGSATASPAVLATVATFPAVQARAGQTTSPSPTTVTVTYPAAAARAGSTPTPAALAVTATFPTPAASGGGNATASPASTLVVVTLPAVSASGGVSATATPVAAVLVATFPAASARAGASTAPAPTLVVVTFPSVGPPVVLVFTGPLTTTWLDPARTLAVTERTIGDATERTTTLIDTPRATSSSGERILEAV